MDEPAPAQKQFGSTLFWRLFALINVVTVAWVGWVIWQLIPRPAVHDFVMRLPVSQRTSSGVISAPASAASDGAATVVPVAPPIRVDEISIQSGPPMTPLKLETEIKTPQKLSQPVIQGK